MMVLKETESDLNNYKICLFTYFMLVFICNNYKLFTSSFLKDSLKNLYTPNIEWV